MIKNILNSIGKQFLTKIEFSVKVDGIDVCSSVMEEKKKELV